jgi:hypothetical protein
MRAGVRVAAAITSSADSPASRISRSSRAYW